LKKFRGLILGIVGCLAFATIGYFWANGLIGSVFSFRSPLRNTPPAPGAPLDTRLSRKVVIVLVDALRYDTSMDDKVMPFLNQLRANGASAKMHSQPPSFSEPGYTTILTGAWPDINDGPAVNLDYADIPTFTQDDIFSAAHRSGLKTAISGYYWFEKLVPQNAVDGSFYTPGEDAAADIDVINAALPMVSDDYQLILIHIDQVDYAGHHLGGPMAPAWNKAATQADQYIHEIVAKLDLKQDTIIVLSDHGQIDRGGHGGPEAINLLEPFVMAGAGVKANVYPDMYQVDVAQTIAVLLGTNLPASSEGMAQTAMLTLSDDQLSKLQAAELSEKRALFQDYVAAIKSQPSRQPRPTVAFSYVAAMNEARADRQTRERPWRVVLALFLVIPPAFFLIVNWKKKFTWLLSGAVIYALVFNFRYAVLDGRTYSLSSVDSETWLISYTAITAVIALAIAWLIVMLRLRAFNAGAHYAARTSLQIVFFTLYLLAIPILISFAINGITVTWTLPEFYSIYVAAQSLLQWVFVPAAGLLLTGVAALVTRLVPRSVRLEEKYRR